MLHFILPEVSSLEIFDNCKIDGCFPIAHGTSTYINADSIGANCTINQNITIGVSNDKRPNIGDNVTIRTGAIVIDGVTIGNNSLIAAGSVVIRDLPSNCMVAGNPAVVKKHLD
ncbi:MAG: hypothetical protein PHE51_09175 [Eubacteriales bacterium]|nr:hypothetical protein [Eubacteriales bacterium]